MHNRNKWHLTAGTEWPRHCYTLYSVHWDSAFLFLFLHALRRLGANLITKKDATKWMKEGEKRLQNTRWLTISGGGGGWIPLNWPTYFVHLCIDIILLKKILAGALKYFVNKEKQINSLLIQFTSRKMIRRKTVKLSYFLSRSVMLND